MHNLNAGFVEENIMGGNKRKTSLEKDKNPGPTKWQKIDESDRWKEASGQINANIEAKNFPSDTSGTNSVQFITNTVKVCDKFKINCDEAYIQPQRRSRKIVSEKAVQVHAQDRLTDINKDIYFRGPTISEEITYDIAGNPVELVKPERQNEAIRDEVTHDRTELQVEDVVRERRKGNISEEFTPDNSTIPVEDGGQERLKQTITGEINHDNSELPAVEINQDKLVGESNEKLNDNVSTLLTAGTTTVEDNKLVQQKVKTTDLSESPLESAKSCR